MFNKYKLSRLKVYSKYGLDLTVDSYIHKDSNISSGHRDFINWYYNESSPEFIWDTLDFYKRISRSRIEEITIT